MTQASLRSIQAGQPRTISVDIHGAAMPEWESGIFKSEVAGPVRATVDGLHGDGQADLRFHGGPDKAVCVYSADHLPLWKQERPDWSLSSGAFGENFTVSGWAEGDVCIGDQWRIGDAVFEVSQPRQPCVKLARRWGQPDLPGRVIATGRTGWYLRVLIEGDVFPGAAIERLQRPYAAWSVTRANAVMYSKCPDRADLAELVALPPLSSSWKDHFRKKLQRS